MASWRSAAASIGPAVVVGYQSKRFAAALFPNYFFGVGDRSDRKSSTPTTSKMDSFGKRAAFRLVLTPVIPGLVSNPIFGGK